MMRAYMIYLGSSMWHDWDSEIPHGKNDPRYYAEMFTQKSAWRKIVDFLPQNGINTVLIDMAEGVQYDSVPEISCKGAWNKYEFREELEHIRAWGMIPIPTFNFSATHDAWFGEYGRMVSTPQYYRAIENLLSETAELFDYPEYIHIGLEEELPHCQNGYGLCVCRNEEVFWHDADFLFKTVRKNKARPWIWGDGFWYSTETYLKNTPKDVLVSNSMYQRIYELEPGDWHLRALEAFQTVAENGFDYLPMVSTCYRELNAYDILEYVRRQCPQEKLKGFISTPWCRTSEEDVYCHYNDIVRFSNALKKVYGEVEG